MSDVSRSRAQSTRPRHQRIKQAFNALRPRRARGKQGLLGMGRSLLWSWWLWTAIAIFLGYDDHAKLAVVFLALALFTYLVTPQERSPRYGLEADFPIHSHEFLSSIVGTTGVQFVKNNRLTILNNGDEFFPPMLAAIAEARSTVCVEAYIYWAGEIGMQFAHALAERGRAGVTVKVLLDAVGSATIGKEILEVLKSGNVEVAWYNPVRWSTIARFNNRTHRKSLIIDGRTAFTGGAGIADQWTGNAQDPDHWREVQVRIEGPSAMGLQTGFANNWLDTTGELVSGGAYFPPPDSAGTVAVQTIMSSPEVGSSSVRIMYYLSIVCARKQILIANPYFIPDDAALEILIEAKQRGVDLKIMVAGEHNDMPISRYASLQLYGNLLEAGVPEDNGR
jgi:cardiolipin synthase A/B